MTDLTSPPPGFWTRRRMLQVGLVSGAALAGGSWLVMRADDRNGDGFVTADYVPQVLSRKELAVLVAFCERVITPTGDAPSVREVRLAERIDRELSFHQAKMQSDVRSALFLLEHGGWLHLAPTRFTHLAPQAQDAYIARMAEGNSLEQQVYANLRLLALYFYYCDERTWPGIQYGGPRVAIAAPPEADSRVAKRPVPHG